MQSRNLTRSTWRAGATIAASLFAAGLAAAGEPDRGILVLTSTNDPGTNQVLVFQLETGTAPALSLVQTLPTGGRGGASGNGGIVQMRDDFGAVANYGSGTVTELLREGDFIEARAQIRLAPGCLKPDSVALTRGQLFIVGANCLESHLWPSGVPNGPVVHLSDASAAQITVGESWGAVTFTSGAVEQVGLTRWGALSGSVSAVALPGDANNTPLGAAFSALPPARFR